MKDDDGLKLDEQQLSYFIRKLRAAAAEDPEKAKDVIEVLQEAVKIRLKDEDYQTFEMARTICEILEPHRLGGIVSMTCSACRRMMSAEEIEARVEVCFQCRVTGS